MSFLFYIQKPGSREWDYLVLGSILYLILKYFHIFITFFPSINSSLDLHLPRYIISKTNVSAGSAVGANVRGLCGLLIIGVITGGSSVYRVFFISGQNQYDTQFNIISTNSFGGGEGILPVYANPNNMDFSIVNNGTSQATAWAYFMGLDIFQQDK